MAITLRPRPFQAENQQDRRRKSRLTLVPEHHSSGWPPSDPEWAAAVDYQFALQDEAHGIFDADGPLSESSPNRSASAVEVKSRKSVPLSVKVKSEPSPSPGVEIVTEQLTKKLARAKCKETTPPTHPFRRTRPSRPQSPKRAADRRTRRRRSAQPSTPVPEKTPKIYLHLRREKVEAPWKFVPRPRMMLRFRRVDVDSSWRIVRD